MDTLSESGASSTAIATPEVQPAAEDDLASLAQNLDEVKTQSLVAFTAPDGKRASNAHRRHVCDSPDWTSYSRSLVFIQLSLRIALQSKERSDRPATSPRSATHHPKRIVMESGPTSGVTLTAFHPAGSTPVDMAKGGEPAVVSTTLRQMAQTRLNV
jgi:hypothetical protein